jgi:hypothetical protein
MQNVVTRRVESALPASVSHEYGMRGDVQIGYAVGAASYHQAGDFAITN